MRSKVVIGLLVFLLILISQAPVGIVRWMLDTTGRASLIGASGTLWRGEGELLVQQRSVGFVTWDLQAVTLLQGKLGYHVTVTGTGQDLEGLIQAGFSGVLLKFDGNVNYVALNPWLAPYNIVLSGDFALANVTARVHDGYPEETGGEVTWTGGPVTYQLAGNISTSRLPEMLALLGPGPEATVYPAGGQTPLLQAAIQRNGFAKVGVTKLLTKMLNTPWPGADPDHAVVLEVEEQVF
jgi:hypothetical protein